MSSQSFTDTFGREWKLSLDPWLVTKVKDECKWKDKDKDGKSYDRDVLLTEWQDETFKLAQALRSDMGLLVNVVWSICDEQAAANGCEATAKKNERAIQREFAAGLGGTILLDVIDALEVAIINFSRNQSERDALMELKRKAEEVTTHLEKKRMELVQEIDTEKVAENFIDSALNSPESQGLTPSGEDSHLVA